MIQGSIDPACSAMLSLDLQAGIVSIYTRDNDLVTRAAALLQAGREAGLTIVNVKVGFRAGVPEIHTRNMLLGAISFDAQMNGEYWTARTQKRSQHPDGR